MAKTQIFYPCPNFLSQSLLKTHGKFLLIIDQGNKGYSCKLISTCIPYLKNQRGES